ncbi:MAG: hypothetical protein CL912_02695 [Deltaproteobacteria bacterium]|nr:hypothetical protein [Deltaproteobacteria bacterium]
MILAPEFDTSILHTVSVFTRHHTYIRIKWGNSTEQAIVLSKSSGIPPALSPQNSRKLHGRSPQTLPIFCSLTD